MVPVLLIFGPSLFDPLLSFLCPRDTVCGESSLVGIGWPVLRSGLLVGGGESLLVGGGVVGLGFGGAGVLADLGFEGGEEGAGLGLTGGVEEEETFGAIFSAFFGFFSLGFVSSGVASVTFCSGNSPAS